MQHRRQGQTPGNSACRRPRPAPPTMLKDLVKTLSLSNFCFIPVWSRLITASVNPRAQWARYDFSSFMAALVNVLTLALVLWAAMTMARRSGGAAVLRAARGVFLLAWLVAIHGVLLTLFPY